MPGSVRRQREAELLSVRGRAAETLVRYVVRMTMLFSTLISAEPWKRPPRLSPRLSPRLPARPRARKAQDWSVSFRNLFS
jgi:hypothetical protein